MDIGHWATHMGLQFQNAVKNGKRYVFKIARAVDKLYLMTFHDFQNLLPRRHVTIIRSLLI